jgi:hypothetical protein
MFQWYKRASICYTYLCDVPSIDDELTKKASLSRSRWFTRGWTLQELIAPTNVVFYSQDWKFLGTKTTMCNLLSSITDIGPEYLNGKNPEFASIAERMSWAAQRNTSRVEDTAYSLMGIFDVNMPLIYGEGKKAFRRLQEEIMKANPYEHSLFAWGDWVNLDNDPIPPELGTSIQVPWCKDASDPLMGLLAESPRDFANSRKVFPYNFVSYLHADDQLAVPTVINKGIMVELPMVELSSQLAYHMDHPQLVQTRHCRSALLFCSKKDGRTSLSVILPLKEWGSGAVGRTKYITVTRRAHPAMQRPYRLRARLFAAPERRWGFQTGDILLLQPIHPVDVTQRTWPGSTVDVLTGSNIISTQKLMWGYIAAYSFLEVEGEGERRGWMIQFSRTQIRARRGALKVSLARVSLDREFGEEEAEGEVWYGYSLITRQKLLSPSSTTFYHHVMKIPQDSWDPVINGLPKIRISVERVTIAGSDATVDIVDIPGVEIGKPVGLIH